MVDELLYHGWPCGGTFSERVAFEVRDGRIPLQHQHSLEGDARAMMSTGGGPIFVPAADGSGKPAS